MRSRTKHAYRLIAVNDVLYHTPQRRPLQDVVTCIREHVTSRSRPPPGSQRRTASEIAARDGETFRKAPAALAETLNFLSRCSFSLDELRKTEYPEEARQGFATPQDALVALVKEGERFRYPNGTSAKIRNALDKELAITAELNMRRIS